MAGWFATVTDLTTGAEVLRRRRFGMIEAADGRFCRVVLRLLPRLVSVPEIALLGRWQHGRRRGDRCRLYYSQPWGYGNFLAVQYVVSTRGTRFVTVCRALEALDAIARLKGTDALLCDVANRRISPAMLRRFGWEPHCPSRWHRHYIKRFYGEYPHVGWVRQTDLDRPRAAGHTGPLCAS